MVKYCQRDYHYPVWAKHYYTEQYTQLSVWKNDEEFACYLGLSTHECTKFPISMSETTTYLLVYMYFVSVALA